MTKEYEALRQGAGLLNLSDRGKIRVSGEDRARLIHAMCTNSVEDLTPGTSCYAFFLNAQGRILADAHIYCRADSLLADTEPEAREKLIGHLDRYIIADDVALDDVTGSLAELAVEGPAAGETIERAGLPLPSDEGSFVESEETLIGKVTATGQPGFRIIGPSASGEALAGRLTDAGAVRVSGADARIVRIENGWPRYGEELTEDYIPHETQVMRALHFAKGCYLGQEIVERVRSRGNVNKLLVHLRISGDSPPEPGSKLTKEEKNAGVIVSAVEVPGGAIAGMGYVRAAHARANVELMIGGNGGTATITDVGKR